MYKPLMTLGAVLVAAGFSAIEKPRSAALLAGSGLVPLIAGILISRKETGAQR